MDPLGGGDIARAVAAMPSLPTVPHVQGASSVANPGYSGKALTFYNLLVSSRVNKQQVIDTKQPNPAPKPDQFLGEGYFEDAYDEPKGAALVPRIFYPESINNDDTFLKWAHNWRSVSASADELANCIDFMKQTKNFISGKINSKLKMHFLKKLRESGVTYKGVPVKTLNDAVQAFREELTSDLCKKLHGVFWGSVEKGHFRSTMEYEIMCEMNLWYSNDKNNELNYDANTKRNKVSTIFSHIQKQCRSNYRKRYQDKSIEHGVKLAISVTGGRQQKDRRIKGGFDFDTCVIGWHGPKHKAWLARKNKEVTLHLGIHHALTSLSLANCALYSFMPCYFQGWCNSGREPYGGKEPCVNPKGIAKSPKNYSLVQEFSITNNTAFC